MIRRPINGTSVGCIWVRPYMGTLKRGAFYTSYLVATLKRAAFSSSRVGAYCIRPIRRHPTNGECANRANYHDSSFHKWNVCGAYAIRPYMGTSKFGAFCTSILGRTLKRALFCTSILDGTLKRGAFCTSYLVATPKRGAFCTSYLVATLKRAAFSSSQVGAYCIRLTNGPLGRKSSYTFDHRRPFFYP